MPDRPKSRLFVIYNRCFLQALGCSPTLHAVRNVSGLVSDLRQCNLLFYRKALDLARLTLSSFIYWTVMHLRASGILLQRL